jgi:hypothetical protein
MIARLERRVKKLEADATDRESTDPAKARAVSIRLPPGKPFADDPAAKLDDGDGERNMRAYQIAKGRIDATEEDE